MKSTHVMICAAAFTWSLMAGAADSLLPPTPVPLDTFTSFKQPGANWTLASGITGNPRNEKTFGAVAGVGVIVNTAAKASGTNLFTAWEHGDLELELDFLVPQGSNSGIYLQSRYEVQLFDSWGVAKPTFSDCGGIYQRYVEAEQRGYEGAAPRVNASRAPGLWQHLHIVFQAPRFDAAGKKTANAKFIQVALNGFIIHENVEVTGPTRSGAASDEVASAPIMIQGDHGPVALRNITIKQFKLDRVTLHDLACAIRAKGPAQNQDSEKSPPDSTPAVTEISLATLDAPETFNATYTGRIELPASGDYAFHVNAKGSVRMSIDDHEVASPLDSGGRGVPVKLTAGSHRFRLDYTHTRTFQKPALTLEVEGPNLSRQALTPVVKASKADTPKELIIEPTDGRVRLQRCFTPYDPLKRLYSIAVGSPTGVHYAYDFDTAAILRVWSGQFLDTSEMWIGRGENQYGKAAGPEVTLPNKPVVALLESAKHDWPDRPDALWTPAGYTLESNGQPVFLANLAGLSISDRIAVTTPARGLHRTLTVTGKNTSWLTGVLLAEASRITRGTGEGSFIIGDHEYYLDVTAGASAVPFIRTINGHDQLMVLITPKANHTTIDYTLTW